MKTSKYDDFFSIDEFQIQKKININLPCNTNLLTLAKKKRKQGILSEVIFWQVVSNGKFYKINFDRQKVIGNYIVDFYVKALGLVVEIDGEIHNFQEEYDEKREMFLKELGLKVFRISTTKMLFDTENVMKDLEQFIITEYKDN